jgi:hypothetical protein
MRARAINKSAGNNRRLLMGADSSIVGDTAYCGCLVGMPCCISWRRDPAGCGNDLDFWSGRSRKIAGVVGRNRCRRRAGADFDWTNQSADWAASGRHCLSWKEYGFLFSFGFFDFVELGLVGFAVLDWEVAPLVLSSWFAVLS